VKKTLYDHKKCKTNTGRLSKEASLGLEYRGTVDFEMSYKVKFAKKKIGCVKNLCFKIISAQTISCE
jgi:hypothetical protein